MYTYVYSTYVYSTYIKGIVSRYKGWLPTNELTRAHAPNENWTWQTANKFASHIASLPAEALSAACSTFQASYVLYSLYLSVFLPFGYP